MRTIREMLGSDEKVWVYIDSRETWERFASMAAAEGFGFGELPEEKWVFGCAVAVHSSGDMGHLPMFVWHRSFSADIEELPKRVEFLKYISGDEDYICRESHFKAAMLSAR
ncbi:hypothetical protein [Ruminococcus flavefaciens]|uniref:hypothetical protein n=1 Tax=Ruminococcus flavefaciens TaxID=1265 RepID=UPI0026F2B9F1|nr:hypothetical protein [Ruminococcus flavefaciens]